MEGVDKESDLLMNQDENFEEEVKEKDTTPGIIYISYIPPKMTPLHLRQIFEKYGEVGRIFLQPAKQKPTKRQRKRDLPSYNTGTFTEGWIEFGDKKLAKKIAVTFHNTLIEDGKSRKFSEHTWNLKYLHRFRWRHLTERLSYEKEVRKHKMKIEMSQARKETEIFTENVETNKRLTSIRQKRERQGREWVEKSAPRKFKQRKTVEEMRQEKQKKLQTLTTGKTETEPQTNSAESISKLSDSLYQRKNVLSKIFAG